MTTVLLLDSDGREHALGHALVAGPLVQLHAAPENPGLTGIRTLHAADLSNPAAMVVLARRVGVDLVVMGPGALLVVGVADAVWETGIDCFDPSAVATGLEGPKAFTKDAMCAAEVPTAPVRVCATPGKAAAALNAYGPPHIVRNDGLAAGRGVVVAPDRAAALAYAKACGKAVIEKFLDEPEPLLLAICSGVVAVPLLPTQDFKRVGDDDAGPNTGGIGVYCPLPWAPDRLVEEVMTRVIVPAPTEMRRRGTPFIGLLYAGLALIARGVRVVEFNVRFGDSKTQVVLVLLEAPLAGVLRAASHGELADLPPLRWCDGAAMMVVEATRSYPDTPVGGGNIDLPVDTGRVRTVYAGTKVTGGKLITSRGRVLGIAGLGGDLDQAHSRAHERLSRVDLPDGFHRTDIGIPR